MIRLTCMLLVALSLAAGAGWLGEAGYPPLVVVHEGEALVVRGPGDREQVFRPTGRVGFRLPFLTEARVVDTRLRVAEVEALALGAEDRVDAQLWWRVVDAAAFVAGAGHRDPESALSADLPEPFARALAVGSASGALDAGVASLETLLLGVARDALRGRGVAIESVRMVERDGTGRVAAMVSERETRRAELRREVAEVASRMSADARREAAQIESEAAREAEIAIGQGEAEAARIYAEAHSDAPEFYAFSRRLEAYRNTLGPNTTLVLSPDHEFFRLLSPTAPGAP